VKEPTCIRGSSERDLRAVHALIQRTIDASYAGIYSARAVAFFREHWSEGEIAARYRDGQVIVAERSGRIIATGALIDDNIVGVYVDPGAQRTGCGRLIMDRLERMAVSQAECQVGSLLDVSRVLFEAGLQNH